MGGREGGEMRGGEDEGGRKRGMEVGGEMRWRMRVCEGGGKCGSREKYMHLRMVGWYRYVCFH